MKENEVQFLLLSLWCQNICILLMLFLAGFGLLKKFSFLCYGGQSQKLYMMHFSIVFPSMAMFVISYV